MDQCDPYVAPESDEQFIALWSHHIKQIINNFEWGGVRHVAVAQAEDLYQELMLDWFGKGYLSVYNGTSRYTNPRTGAQVRGTFRNFVFQFVFRRLLNWRDQFNRQVYKISTEYVVTEPGDKACKLVEGGVSYVTRRRFTRHIAMQDLVDDENKEYLFQDRGKTPDTVVADIDSMKHRCGVVYNELLKMKVVSKRDFAKLFRCLVQMAVQQDVVKQADIAVQFDCSPSTISLMVKQLQAIPAVRNFQQQLERDLVCG